MKKEIQNYVFVQNGDFERNLNIFCSRFTHSCLWPFSFHSFLLPHDFRPPVSDRRGFTGLMAEGSMFNDVGHEAWQRTRSDLSGPHRSLIAFTLPASVEGGCKRIGRIPRVMRSQLIRQSHYLSSSSHLQTIGEHQHLTELKLSSTSCTVHPEPV